MDVVSLEIEGVKLIQPRRFSDSRGFFAEVWNRRTFAEAGIEVDFVQDNYSYSVSPGTVRGLHYQEPPRAQAKLVRVQRGSVFDVAVDIRSSSPTFGRHVSTVLSAANGEQIFIPIGFAHGFCTLEPDTEVAYKISDFFSPEHDTGIAWDDAELAIAWPLGGRTAVLSDRDRGLPALRDAGPAF
jgi:dTDP-4-dehydrorhamnose 3,5-epimerase